jgi:hypothetical protein
MKSACVAASLALAALVAVPAAAAPQETVLYRFKGGRDGGAPQRRPDHGAAAAATAAPCSSWPRSRRAAAAADGASNLPASPRGVSNRRAACAMPLALRDADPEIGKATTNLSSAGCGVELHSPVAAQISCAGGGVRANSPAAAPNIEDPEHDASHTGAPLSDNPAEPVVDLAYIGRALQRMTTDMAALRDEMRVQTAMITGQDAAIVRLAASIAGQDVTMNTMLEQLRAMVAQHQRTADRVRRLEEQR